jgi:uncharacterized damage-inducible protein DinB
MPTILTLLDHAAWADARARLSIDDLPPSAPERDQALRLYAHLAAAEHVWLSRIEGRAAEHVVWPTLDLDAAAALATESIAALRRIAEDVPERLRTEITYRNTAGQEFRSVVEDIIVHVALHGSYHRGQIALLARAGGAAPGATDYIVFVRGVAAPSSSPSGATTPVARG